MANPAWTPGSGAIENSVNHDSQLSFFAPLKVEVSSGRISFNSYFLEDIGESVPHVTMHRYSNDVTVISPCIETQ